jgi:hypothetical protein
MTRNLHDGGPVRAGQLRRRARSLDFKDAVATLTAFVGARSGAPWHASGAGSTLARPEAPEPAAMPFPAEGPEPAATPFDADAAGRGCAARLKLMDAVPGVQVRQWGDAEAAGTAPDSGLEGLLRSIEVHHRHADCQLPPIGAGFLGLQATLAEGAVG